VLWPLKEGGHHTTPRRVVGVPDFQQKKISNQTDEQIETMKNPNIKTRWENRTDAI